MKRTTALALAAAGGLLLWRRARPSNDPGILGPQAVRDLYDRLAPVYDAAAAWTHRIGTGDFYERAVQALDLQAGETAVDLGCGTGPNLPHLVRAVGPTGRVVAVDISPRMLDRARERAEANGWQNVELVEADVRDFSFPEALHGVVGLYALEMVPEHDAVVERAVAALAPGRRIAVGGLRRPERWPEWAVHLGELVNRPFGVSRAYEGVQPWRAVEAHAEAVRYEEHVLGAVYLCAGEAPTEGTPPPAPTPETPRFQ